jgi:hypothetical protein
MTYDELKVHGQRGGPDQNSRDKRSRGAFAFANVIS